MNVLKNSKGTEKNRKSLDNGDKLITKILLKGCCI